MKQLKIIVALVSMSLMVFSFSNCSSQEGDSTLFKQLKSVNCLDIEDDECFTQNSDNLSIGTTATTIFLKANQTTFNIGGECNEGGFLKNRVDWHLQYENNLQLIANSLGTNNQEHTICGNPSLLSQNISSTDGLGNKSRKCVDGRFQVQVTLPSAIPLTMSLKLCISGVTSSNQFVMGGSTFHVVVSRQ